ncbi:MAG: hypothetical protein ACD_79C00781G0002 [uncultured bacterium]|nr:MAG: hypothetical protein ACD_79C00781G0002 [uncultured bacterium]
MFIDESVLEEIKQRIDIVDIISSTVNLKNAGKNMKGLCPFHNEKTPSFIVNRIRQQFHCFGCGASGDVFTYTMKNEGLTFVESVKKIAGMAGIDIKETDSISPLTKKKNLLFEINQEAAQWFHKNLLTSNIGLSCMEYVKSRGLNQKTMEDFMIGYAPSSWNDLTNYLTAKGYSNEVLLESGLIIQSEKNNTVYDRFRDRLMFPIFNPSGLIAGFSGRTLSKKDDIAKYVNTPETLIFKKNQLLYAMFQSRPDISKKDHIIIVEGHIDTCAMHQHGFTHAVGVQGTAFTDDHALWISKYTKNIKILFDGDNAGINAALRILPIGLSHSLNCTISELPKGEDPASFLLKGEIDKLTSLVDNSANLFDYKIKKLTSGKTPDPNLKVKIVDSMLEDLLSVKNPVYLDSLLQHLSNALQINPESVKEVWHKKTGKAKPALISTEPDKKISKNAEAIISQFSAAERDLLRILIDFPESHEEIFLKINFEWIQHSDCNLIANSVFKLSCEKSYSFENLVDSLIDNNSLISIIQKLKGQEYGEKLLLAISDMLNRLESDFYLRKRNELQKQLNEISSKDSQNKIKEEITFFQKKIINLKSSKVQ